MTQSFETTVTLYLVVGIVTMLKFRGYKLFYQTRDAAESMIRQIEEFPSFFTPQDERPLIVDCGSNIGVSVLEWKTRWPGCQVLCFEPDPFAFRILQKNIEVNDIPGVRCFNVALSNHDGREKLYGNVSKNGDARGNSIDPAWGDRRAPEVKSHNEAIEVVCKRLSPYLEGRNVSFLKLDIEGAEQQVLAEIVNELERIEAIYVEIHQTRENESYNSVRAIERQLMDAGFTIEAESRYDEHALPLHLEGWRKRVGASQTQLMAWRQV